MRTKKTSIYKNTLLFLLWSFCLALQAQESLKKGEVIASITIESGKDESFALYLPKTYNPNVLSSILFIYDPSGSGTNGIKNFIPVADRFNFILVSSNNSKNGPYDRNFGITNRLFDQVFAQFRIDEKRIYLAGFSGGSRLATAIAVLTNNISGVVACGAGFPNVPQYTPSSQNFAYVGVCGTKDMNYKEMLNVKTYLQKLKFNHTLITYEGTHSWPPSEQLLRAFAWLELQAHRKGQITKAEAELKKFYEADYVLTKELIENGNLLGAAENFERMLLSYSFLFRQDSIQAQYKELYNGKAYKSTLKSRNQALEQEVKIQKRLGLRFTKDYENPEQANMGWWEKEITKLNASSLKANAEQVKMYERVKFHLFAVAYSRGNPLLHTSNSVQTEFCLNLRKLLYPEFVR